MSNHHMLKHLPPICSKLLQSHAKIPLFSHYRAICFLQKTKDGEYVFLIGFNVETNKRMNVSFPCSHKNAENVFRPCTDLLFTVPFTASPTNAIEMNKAMTSSVDLEKNRINQLSLICSSVTSCFYVSSFQHSNRNVAALAEVN